MKIIEMRQNIKGGAKIIKKPESTGDSNFRRMFSEKRQPMIRTGLNLQKDIVGK